MTLALLLLLAQAPQLELRSDLDATPGQLVAMAGVGLSGRVVEVCEGQICYLRCSGAQRLAGSLVVTGTVSANTFVVTGTTASQGISFANDANRINWAGGAFVDATQGVRTNNTWASSIASGSRGFNCINEGCRVGIGPDTYLVESGSDINAVGGDLYTTTGRMVSRNASGGFSFGSSGNEFLGMTGGASTISVSSGAVMRWGSAQNTNESIQLGGRLAIANTNPTVSSGFGTSPSVASNNGTAAFTINVGTGGTASSGVIGLPAATNGWVCHCADVTTPGANITRQTASSTTSCTVTNVAMSTGASTAWTASDILHCIAVGR